MKIFKKIFCYSLLILFMPLILVGCKNKNPSYTDGLVYKLSSNGEYYILTDLGTVKEDTINIPDQFNGLEVRIIGESAFENYTFIKKIIMPDTITTIGNSAFKDCHSLTNIVFSNSLKVIEDYAFYDCKNLQNIDLPNSVEEIGNCAFYNCENFTELKIKENIKSIGNSAFYNCINLEKLYFNAKHCQNLGPQSYAFYKAGKNVQMGMTVYISNSVQSLPAYMFCNNFIYEDSPNITNVIFEENSECSYIGYYTFAFCNTLTSIIIPSSVSTIDSCAFIHCDNLKSVKFENANNWIGTTKGTNIQTVIIDINDTTDFETVATYLCNVYSSYCWVRTNS